MSSDHVANENDKDKPQGLPKYACLQAVIIGFTGSEQPSSFINTPEQVRTFAEVVPRKWSTRRRKFGTIKVLIDTSVKKQIEAEENAKMGKRS